ncbi:hypothetical protein ACIPZG_08545 [Pseudomonas sp. NPDC089395]|uniref:hypothetical protein n=1 Tax=Pseudomonas sp. NPDC089395 TaxID=3364460 RepID=UPI00381A8EAA
MNFSVNEFDDASLVSFDSSLARDERHDIHCLLAQADAFSSRAFDRDVLWKSWLDRYRNRLVKHGCEERQLLSLEPVVVNSLEAFNQQLALTLANPTVGGLVEKGLLSREVLEKREFAERFFAKGSADGRSNTFLVTPCGKNDQGEIILLVYVLHLSAGVDSREAGGYGPDIRRELVLWRTGNVYRFDRAVYAGYRQEIRQSLSESSLRHIDRHVAG